MRCWIGLWKDEGEARRDKEIESRESDDVGVEDE